MAEALLHPAIFRRENLFHVLLVNVDHLLDHLAPQNQPFGGQVAVITLLEVYADFAGSFHLKLV